MQAAQIDERIKNGETLGPLAGLPIAVKVIKLTFSCNLP